MRARTSATAIALGGALLTLATVSPIRAQVSLQWTHAAAGLHRAQGLVPLHLRLESSAPQDMTLVLQASWGEAATRLEQRIDLAAGARKEIDLYLGPVEGFSVELDLHLHDADGNTLEHVRTSSVEVPRGQSLVGILDPHPMGWGALQATNRYHGKVTHLNPRGLPGRSDGLGAFDVLIWPNPRPRAIRREQVEALRHWVEEGGVLVLAAPSQAEATAPWTSIRSRERQAVDRLSAVLPTGSPPVHSSTGRPITAPGPFAEPLAVSPLDAPATAAVDVWLHEPWGTSVASARLGFGEVVVFAFDPRDPRLASSWLEELWIDLLRRTRLSAQRNQIIERRYLPLLHELADSIADQRMRLRGILSSSGRAPFPMAGLGILLGLYFLIIGPGEYLVLRRLGRLRWTWLTLPLWVGLFSIAAWATAASTRPSVTTLHHVLVRDLVPGATSFREEIHASYLATRRGEHTLGPRLPGALPLLAAEHEIVAYEIRSAFRRTTYDQATSSVRRTMGRWSFLNASFARRRDAAGAQVETTPDGRLTPRLGVDLQGARLVLALDGTPYWAALGELRDGVEHRIGRRQHLSWTAGELNEVDTIHIPDTDTEPAEGTPEALIHRVAYASSRWLPALSTGRLGTQPGERPPLTSRPGLDWSTWLAEGGTILLGWAPDPQPRIRVTQGDSSADSPESEPIAAAETGWILYRVALPPSFAHAPVDAGS